MSPSPARQLNNVMRRVIEAISDIAGLESQKDELNFSPGSEPIAGGRSERKGEQAANPCKQRVALNELIESSLAYVESLIDSEEVSEAIDFSNELIQRFHPDLLSPGFEKLFNEKGTAWLESHVQQLTASREFAGLERAKKEEKYFKQLAKLPVEIQSRISDCVNSPPPTQGQLWLKVQGDARKWLIASKSRDIDLDKFVESLGKRDIDFEKLAAIEDFFGEKLEAAQSLINLLSNLELTANKGKSSFSPAGPAADNTSLDSIIQNLNQPLTDSQCHAVKTMVMAIIDRKLPRLKQILTHYKGTPSDFSCVARAIEELLAPLGINVTSAHGQHWAILNMESLDYKHGIQLCMPSGKICGHLKGTAYSAERAAEALAALADIISQPSE